MLVDTLLPGSQQRLQYRQQQRRLPNEELDEPFGVKKIPPSQIAGTSWLFHHLTKEIKSQGRKVLSFGSVTIKASFQ